MARNCKAGEGQNKDYREEEYNTHEVKVVSAGCKNSFEYRIKRYNGHYNDITKGKLFVSTVIINFSFFSVYSFYICERNLTAVVVILVIFAHCKHQRVVFKAFSAQNTVGFRVRKQFI